MCCFSLVRCMIPFPALRLLFTVLADYPKPPKEACRPALMKPYVGGNRNSQFVAFIAMIHLRHGCFRCRYQALMRSSRSASETHLSYLSECIRLQGKVLRWLLLPAAVCQPLQAIHAPKLLLQLIDLDWHSCDAACARINRSRGSKVRDAD